MPRQTMTLRLDETTRRRLASAGRRRGRTPSECMRAAIEAWLASEEGAAGSTPYEAVADLVGRVRGGDSSRSTRSIRARAASPEHRLRR